MFLTTVLLIAAVLFGFYLFAVGYQTLLLTKLHPEQDLFAPDPWPGWTLVFAGPIFALIPVIAWAVK